MYANCEQVHLKGTLGRLVPQYVNQLSEFYTDLTVIPYKFNFLASYHSFRQGEGVGDILHNVIDFLKKEQKIWSHKPEVLFMVKIILFMSATSASSKCTFITLRRVKSYLQTTMSNNRLNHLMTCRVHKELVKEQILKAH